MKTMIEKLKAEIAEKQAQLKELETTKENDSKEIDDIVKMI